MATTARQQYFADETSLQKDSREFSIADDIQQKIASVEPWAEVNTIETVKVNWVALTPDANKAVNINIPDVIDNLYTVDADDALSAKQWKLLYDYIQNLQTIGRFLSNWNSATGLPVTNPSESPYAYKAWDYYRVSNVAASPATNYKPNGSSFVIWQASTTVETNNVNISDLYLYDGTDWILLSNSWSSIAIDSSLSTTSTNPVENRVITNTLNWKQDALTAWTWIDITSNTISTKWIEVNVATANGTAAKVWTTTAGNYTPTKWDFLLVNFVNGCSVDNPTLNVDWSWAKNIRTGSANAAKGTFALWTTANSNIKALMYYDWTYYRVWSTSNTNTTYSTMSVSEWQTGTATSARTMRADYLKSIIKYHAVDDTAYASSWDWKTDIAPSQNAVYDKIESLSTVPSWWTNWQVLTQTANWPAWQNATGGVTSVNWQTWAVTVSEFTAISGWVKVFTFPSTNDDITDLVTWLASWWDAILKETNNYCRVTTYDGVNREIRAIEDSSNSRNDWTIEYNSSKIVTNVSYTDKDYFAPDNAWTTDQVLTKTSNWYEWQTHQRALKVTLTSNWWNNSNQTVTATGVTSTNTIIVSPVPADISDYTDAGIYCSAQGTDSLTFTCSTTPSGDIEVNVVILSVEIWWGGWGGWTPWANTIAYYPLESDAKDYSWNNNDGTNNGVTFSNVWGVDCAVFTSASTKIWLPWFWNFTTLTVSAWIKTTASISVSQVVGIAPTSDNKNFSLSIYNWTATLSRYTWNSYNITDGTVNDWTWHNIIGTYTSAWWTKLYVDWVYIDADSTTTAVSSSSGYTFIGWHQSWQSMFAYSWNISNVILETAERTAQDVQDYFNQTKWDYWIS